MDYNCISYWLPLLLKEKIPVPRTEIVTAECNLISLIDSQIPDGFEKFSQDLADACKKVGYPAFLRTGHTSGKHGWDETCFVKSEETLKEHVENLVEYSAMADIFGLPVQTWAVREFLELEVGFNLPAYSNMPLAREFRGFVDYQGEGIMCIHPYWPKKAVDGGNPPPGWEPIYDQLCDYRQDYYDIEDLLSAVCLATKKTERAWSVDLCKTKDGRWLVTDMALALHSYHWDGCVNAPKAEPPPEINFDEFLQDAVT